MQSPPGPGMTMTAKIECPKCGFKQKEGTKCLCCGVIFSRIRRAGDPIVPGQTFKQRSRSNRSPLQYLRRYFSIFRWISLFAVIAAVVLVLYDSHPPEITVTPYAVKQAENKVRIFQSTIRQEGKGRLEMDQSEVNGWLQANLVLANQRPDSVGSREPGPAVKGTNPSPETLEFDNAALEEAKSSLRDIRVELLEDTLCIYAVFDMHGVSLSLEIEGRLRVWDGYLSLEPVRGKLGSLPLSSGILRNATTKIFESPENREMFRLLPQIRELKVDHGRLIISSR